MPGLQTLDQQRAAFAWEKVTALGGGLGDYLPLVRQLPAMVQTNGLGQALAFLIGETGAKQQLYLQLQQWLCTAAPHPVYPPEDGREVHLVRSLVTGDSLTLRHATQEVQALAVWLKRFAEAKDGGASSTPTTPVGRT